MSASKLSADKARRLFHYDHEAGCLTWAVNRGKVRAGDVAGTPCRGRNHYLQVCVDYRLYRVHRVIWLMVTGEWPKGEIDHIDGDGLNNSWRNLRDVGRQENARNMRMPASNSSGAIGVIWHKKAGKWQARIHVEGKTVYLGLYESKDAAIAARKAEERRLGFHANHGRHAADGIQCFH